MTQHFIKTDSVLDKILAHKVEEIEERKANNSETDSRSRASAEPAPPNFLEALQRDTVALIAEVKKASPSKGVMIENFNPLQLAKIYSENGAACISVLTDEKFFQGSLGYLQQVNDVVSIPTLCKEFIIDPFQIYEARLAGASAVLLIVAALSDSQLQDLQAAIIEVKMTPLVEVHSTDSS